MRSSPERRVYRGALIGLGGIARLGHLPAFQLDAGVASRLEIVGIVDSAPVLAVDGIPLVSNPDHLSTLGPIDFVDICTPTALHLPLSLWALSQGYHVLCEKPVAVTRAAAAAACCSITARISSTSCSTWRGRPRQCGPGPGD